MVPKNRAMVISLMIADGGMMRTQAGSGVSRNDA